MAGDAHVVAKAGSLHHFLCAEGECLLPIQGKEVYQNKVLSLDDTYCDDKRQT